MIAAVIAIAAAMVMTILMMAIVPPGQMTVTAMIPVVISVIVAGHRWMRGHENGDGRDGSRR